jgi:hypothetical protein
MSDMPEGNKPDTVENAQPPTLKENAAGLLGAARLELEALDKELIHMKGQRQQLEQRILILTTRWSETKGKAQGLEQLLDMPCSEPTPSDPI